MPFKSNSDPSEEILPAYASLDLTTAKVLLVEDSDEDALLFCAYVKRIVGYTWQVDRAHSYAEAAKALEKDSYDLYFIDYRLGSHSGLDVLHELNKYGYRAPAVLITGLDDDKIGEDALIAGATEFLPKDELSPKSLARTARYAAIRRNAELRLQINARQDGLTQVFNRSHFLKLATAELARARRFNRPISLLMLDIDYFKQVNDTYGHPVGDRIIQSVVDSCRNSLRASDLIGRYGGDEFVMLLPNTTPDESGTIASRIQKNIRQVAVPTETTTVKTSVSIGIACAAVPITSEVTKLIEAADGALYRAKELGRSRSELATETD